MAYDEQTIVQTICSVLHTQQRTYVRIIWKSAKALFCAGKPSTFLGSERSVCSRVVKMGFVAPTLHLNCQAYTEVPHRIFIALLPE